ncbi:hypothetical protein JRQ81_007872 [Phrynocephalus forsythii]|uniref:Uncharacterized protein n=1 Tax=Phrynocephalus forsythii TaxID=171643 RepID=A0A9Q1AT39_9SAUR|nr:hypothetical protein JRQ81_007872 [Phrynocephalus forsythii]
MHKKHQAELQAMQEKLASLEKRIAASHNQYQDLQATHEKVQSEWATRHDVAVQELKQKLQETEQLLANAQKMNGDLEKQAKELKRDAEHAKTAKTAEDALQIVEQVTKEKETLHKEKMETLASLEDLKQVNQKLQRELDTLKEQNLKNQEEFKKSQDLLNGENKKIEEIRKELEALKLVEAEKSQHLAALQAENAKLAEELGKGDITAHQKLEEERSVLNNQLLEMKKSLPSITLRESNFKKEIDEERASLQKSISITSALITEKDEELEKLRNEVTVLRGENATARNLHSLVQSLEADKLKLELKVKNLEQKLRESQKSPSATSDDTASGALQNDNDQESRVRWLAPLAAL